MNTDYILIFRYLKYSAIFLSENAMFKFYQIIRKTEFLEHLQPLLTLKFCHRDLRDTIKKFLD